MTDTSTDVNMEEFVEALIARLKNDPEFREQFRKILYDKDPIEKKDQNKIPEEGKSK